MLRLFPALLLVVPHAPAAIAAPSAPMMAADDGCKASTKKKSGMFGSALGTLAGRALGRSTFGGIISINTVTQTLTDAIACKLDRDEQKQAAAATETAITRGVGATENWTSDTREGVSGTSTVDNATKLADGSNCMTVTDVVIVDGEETTAKKKMCRAPGSNKYVVSV